MHAVRIYQLVTPEPGGSRSVHYEGIPFPRIRSGEVPRPDNPVGLNMITCTALLTALFQLPLLPPQVPVDSGPGTQASRPAPVASIVQAGAAALARFEPAPGRDPRLWIRQDTTRPRAIEYSDGYYTRLKIHKIASYATLPLFIAQYAAGEELYRDGNNASRFARDIHGPLAGAIAGLFVVNTTTGVWNLWEGRKDPNGRTRRMIHGLSQLAAGVGFLAVGATAPENEDGGVSDGNRGLHKGLAIGSMSVSLASYLMMLIWKD